MRSGGLFAGYGGLDMAVAEVFGAEPAWFSEIDEAPSRILDHHWPDVPNHGDITQIDWDTVEPVDILSGGFPCQDVSAAGKRAGLHPDTRSGLWNHMAYAISKLRPRYVVAENVRGLLSAEAHSDVEPCPWCLGDGPGEPALRALGAVLADLGELGYDAQWCGLRAADVGAPHGRFRVFVLAADTQGLGHEWIGPPRHRWTGSQDGGNAAADPEGARLAARGVRGGPAAIDAATWHSHVGTSGGTTASYAAGERHGDTWTASLGGVPAAALAGATAHPHGDPIREQSVPIPRSGGSTVSGIAGSDAAERRTSPVAWGGYRPAIERWERVLGRPAPAPTETSGKGSQRLSPRFVEWMMGLPDGHVTAVPGVNRNAQLKALGNGVVPQQAVAALRHMLSNLEAA